MIFGTTELISKLIHYHVKLERHLYKGRPNESGIAEITMSFKEKDDCVYFYKVRLVLKMYAICPITPDACVIAGSM